LAGSTGATTAAFGGSGLGCGGVALEQPHKAIPQKTPNHWIDGTRFIATAPKNVETREIVKREIAGTPIRVETRSNRCRVHGGSRVYSSRFFEYISI
jgi:hypothetical protein